MNKYKIKNITNTFDKRDVNFNQNVKICYSDNIQKCVIDIKPNDTAYVSFDVLPPDLLKYRVKGLVKVTPLTDDVFASKTSIKKIDAEKNKKKKSDK